MSEKPGSQQQHEVASSSYMRFHTVTLDNVALASGKLSDLYTDLQAQILGTASTTSPDVQQIALRPENLRPGEFERMQQIVQLVFGQLQRGYDRIRANRQNQQFSLKTSSISAKVEMNNFRNSFMPQATLQVMDLVSTKGGEWILSPVARGQLVQAFNFVENILLATNKGHPILGELNRYPGTIARSLQALSPDRARAGLSQQGDPTMFGLDEVLPDAFTRGSITQQTGAPAHAEERGRLGRNQPDTPGKPLKIPRPPKP